MDIFSILSERGKAILHDDDDDNDDDDDDEYLESSSQPVRAIAS